MEKHPEILTHPNIPKPLHGLNPRTILGTEWWDETRRKVYDEQNNLCLACGVHKSDAKYKHCLEAHEYYKIDYGKGVAEVIKIVALCHCCHAFIHSGLLLVNSRKSSFERQKAINILNRGFNILDDNHLIPFPGTVKVATKLGMRVNRYFHIKIDDSMREGNVAEWSSWKLILNGKEYPGKFATFEDWKRHYNNMR